MNVHPCNAIVLLGYSGAGKDTLANLLAEEVTEVINAKFGMVNKQIIADLFKVPPALLDDRDWRTKAKLVLKGRITDVTAFDLLTALFRGSAGTPLEKLHLTETIAWCEGCLPVFTDIRRLQEFETVLENYNPLVIYLSRADVVKGVNDGEIHNVWNYSQGCPRVINELLYITSNETEEETFARFKKLVGTYVVTKFRKPILHVFISKSLEKALNHTLQSSLPSYEPLGRLASSLAKIACEFSIDAHGFNSLFSAAVRNVDYKQLKIEPIEVSSTMIWNEAHEHFLEQLRQYANIKVHVLDDCYEGYAENLFTTKELHVEF